MHRYGARHPIRVFGFLRAVRGGSGKPSAAFVPGGTQRPERACAGRRHGGGPVHRTPGQGQSVYAAQTIRDALSELAGLASLAAQGGLTSNSTQLLSADGTRVSRGNIQAQLDRAVALINSLVDASAVGNANFIDGGGPAIRIQTSRYGGSVDILPQGLDTFSLGLANLDVSTQADAKLSRARLESASDTAGSRINRLVQLQSALGQTSAFDQSLIAATTNISGALPVGAFVNLSA